MTNTPELKPCPFDPAIESNWHFHDEYEFWYIEFPEIMKPDAKYKIDLARERSFKPWEEYKKFTKAGETTWQPIDSFPLDYKEHLFFNGKNVCQRFLQWDKYDGYYYTSMTGVEIKPTHWMPLPLSQTGETK